MDAKQYFQNQEYEGKLSWAKYSTVQHKHLFKPNAMSTHRHLAINTLSGKHEDSN